MNCVTRAPILLLRSWVALSFKVCEWGSNYESLLSFRAARTTKNEKKSSLTDFSDLHLKAAPHCSASVGTWSPGWMSSWQWLVTMVRDKVWWHWFVTMDGGLIIWQGKWERRKCEIRCEQSNQIKLPTRATLRNDVLVRPGKILNHDYWMMCHWILFIVVLL